MSLGPQTYLCNHCSQVHYVGNTCTTRNTAFAQFFGKQVKQSDGKLNIPPKTEKKENAVFQDKFEPCIIVPLGLTMEIYAELKLQGYEELAEKLKKCVTGEK